MKVHIKKHKQAKCLLKEEDFLTLPEYIKNVGLNHWKVARENPGRLIFFYGFISVIVYSFVYVTNILF